MDTVYTVRLYCTSSEHYKPPNLGYQQATAHITNKNIPIEYPGQPEVFVDDYLIPFKEKGLRGKPGSAPPLDLDKSSRKLVRQPGRMASVSMSHMGPSLNKKKEGKVGVTWASLIQALLVPGGLCGNGAQGGAIETARSIASYATRRDGRKE
jgi:hypothetical protein